jgi:hypothetical protein
MTGEAGAYRLGNVRTSGGYTMVLFSGVLGRVGSVAHFLGMWGTSCGAITADFGI